LAFNDLFASVATTVPLQEVVLNSVNVTVPLGAGAAAGVPAAFATVASSCTTVPDGTVVFVTSAFDASRTTVVTTSSAQFFDAFPDPPEAVLTAVPVVRVIEIPPTGIADVADTTVVPVAAEVIVTVQLAVAPPPV